MTLWLASLAPWHLALPSIITIHHDKSIIISVDLPMIISTDTAALLDPHRKYSGSGRMGWDDDLEKFLQHSGHAACFDGMFGLTRFTKNYNATLFRFPLRTIESNSKLVSSPYPVERVRGFLYNSFIKEAPIMLLFLKYIEEISLYDNDRLIYKISIEPSQIPSIRQERQFLMQLAERHASSCSLSLFSVSFVIEDYRSMHPVHEKYHWLVINTIGSTDAEIIQMAKDQRSLPWVGIAAPLPQRIDISKVSLAKLNISKVSSCIENLHKNLRTNLMSLPWSSKLKGHIKGQVFCFLPLPNTTHLPVNIHGYFAVGNNRRSIEWPADDNKSQKAYWNKALLCKHIAPLYSILLACRTQLVTYTGTPLPLCSTEGEDITDPFIAWPLSSNVKYQSIWNELLAPVIEGITKDVPILWTSAHNGSWVSINKAFYLPKSEGAKNCTFPLPNIAIDVLIQAGFPVVSLPNKIRETLIECEYQSLIEKRTINPGLIRQALKNLSDLACNDMEIVQDLLECILFDITTENATDLDKIKLLPLAAAAFRTTTFQQKKKFSHDDFAFVVDAETKCILKFLPYIEEQIVSTSLRPPVASKLQELAQTECLQLRMLTPYFVACHLLPKSIRSWYPPLRIHQCIRWSPGVNDHPPLDWIASLWEWLCKNPNTLPLFVGLPIVPQEMNVPLVTLLSIPKINTSSYFVERGKGDAKLANILRKIGAVVVHDSFVFAHRQISNYIFKINTHSVLNYIHNHGPSIISPLDSDERGLLRMDIASYYSGNQEILPKVFGNTIKQLQIFELTDPTQLVSVDQKYILPKRTLKFDSHLSYPKNIYNNREKQVVNILQKLGLVCQHDDTLFVKIILPYALQQCKSNSNWCNGDDLIVWMLKHDSQLLLNVLRNEPFIRTKADMNICRKASQLYYIHDEQFEKLFDCNSDPVFPSDVYEQKESMPKLLSIGLITWKSLIRGNSRQLVALMKERAESVQFLSTDAAKQRSSYILELAGANRQFVNIIMDELKKVPFISVQVSSPKSYPAFLQWAGREKANLIEAPCNVYHNSVNPYLIGSILPVSAEYYVSSDIRCFFRSPTPIDVLKQLQILVDYVRVPLNNISEIDKVTAMVHCIYKYLNNNCTYVKADELPNAWVWWSNEQSQKIFMPLSKFVWTSEVPLSPLLYTVTSDPHIACYSALFETAGVRKSLELSEVANILQTISLMFPQSEMPDNFIRMSLKVIKYLKEKRYRSTGDVYLLTVGNQLFPARECTYDDRQWCKRRVNAHLASRHKFIHNDISPETAYYFGVEPLSKRVAPSEMLKLKYISSGFKKKVAKYIGSIVNNNYNENIDVFKELLQNADDAGASEVKILIDWREHDITNLFEQSMKYWQGPAIIVYNNATFTDQDFENICEITTAAKLNDPSKTGRYGVGFCACYRLTDVPSFLTRQFLTIFDPHARFLGNRVSYDKPGMRINLVKDPEALVIFEDQLAPFDELFGCNVFQLHGNGFNGTIFRFPLRRANCPKSEICNKNYDRCSVEHLIEELMKEATNLILFQKHVKMLQLFILENDASNPSQMKLHFKVQKQFENSISRITMIQDPYRHLRPICSIVAINVIDNTKLTDSTTQYVLSSSVCSTTTSTTIVQPAGFVPIVELAIKLQNNIPDPMVDGRLFCFLSLPIKSDLPFHVSGFFDVEKDKKALVKDGKNCSSWNECLVRNALPSALEAALSIICKQMKLMVMKAGEKSNCLDKYYSLWPGAYGNNSSRFTFLSSRNWVSEVFSQEVAKTLCSSKEEILWSNVNGGNWISPKNAYIFTRDVPEQIREEAVDFLLSKGYGIVECPQHVYNLLLSSQQSFEQGPLISYKYFFENVFLPNIYRVDESFRNHQLLFVMNQFREEQSQSTKRYDWVYEALHNHSCIPVAVTGHLVKPTDLIDVSCEHIASLYDPEEGRFPDAAFNEVLSTLILLGMVTSTLPMDELRQKANSISNIKNEKEYVQKLSALFNYIQYVKNHSLQSRFFSFGTNEKENQTLSALYHISFLKPSPKPIDVALPWFSSEKNYFTPLELISQKYSALVFTQKPIFHLNTTDDKLDQNKLELYLGINNNLPSVQTVLNHICCLVTYLKDKELDATTVQYLKTENVFSAIYHFLQQQADKSSIKDILHDRQCIWQSDQLYFPTQVLINWEGISCLPYLCPLSPENKKFAELFVAVGVLEEANLNFLISLLESILKDHYELPISEELVAFVDIITLKISVLPEFKKSKVDVLLPDENCILRRASTLSCEKSSESPVFKDFKAKGGHFIYEQFPQDRALYLGAYFLTDAILRDIEDENFLNGTLFDNSEDLIDHLNVILKLFPADTYLFREILKSLDDAGATEVVFVLDYRTQYSQNSLLCSNENWKDLQSTPALCVITNCSFSNSTISSILKLNKREKDIKQIGVGFSVVYHVTDCPSFVSFDSNENPLNFCAFDPLQKYCNKGARSKSVRKWNINKSHMEQFPNQFEPFLFLELLKDKSKGSIVFRFPLSRFQPQARGLFQKSEKWLSEGKCYRIIDIDRLLINFKMSCNNALLFFESIKRISVFKKQEQYNNFLHDFTSTLHVNAVSGAFDAQSSSVLYEVTTETEMENNISQSQWIVCKKSGFEQSNNMAEDRGFGGVAAQLQTTKVPEFRGYWFCCISTDVPNDLPVHVNAHFLLIESHEKLGSHLEKWNSITKNFLVPAYIELILKARDKVNGSIESIMWFYDLFPKLTNSQQPQSSQPMCIKHLLFEQLLRENYPILVDARRINAGKINWLTPQDARYCIDQTLVKVEETKHVLILLEIPITCAPSKIFESFAQVSKDYKAAGLVTPSKVLQWLKSIKLEDKNIAIIKANCELLLEFCLQNSSLNNMHEELLGVPLLLTCADTLSISGKLFVSSFAELLPHCHERFIDPLLEKTNVAKNLLKTGNIITDLPLLEVASNIKLHDVKKPVQLSNDEIVLVKLLWEYFRFMNVEMNDVAKHFSNKPILPVSDGWFYPPLLRNCLFRETSEQVHIQTVLLKLGYKKLDFGHLDQMVTPTFVYPLVSESYSDITKRFRVCPPPILNSKLDFNNNEVDQLVALLSQKDKYSPNLLTILKQLPVFPTIDETYISLSSIAEFIIKPSMIPNDGISTIQFVTGTIVLKMPEHHMESFYRKIISHEKYTSAQESATPKFYLDFVIPHISHFKDSELLSHLQYICRDILLLQKSGSISSKWANVIEKLKSIPLISVENQRHAVSGFYDPDVEFYLTFKEGKLPPQSWRTKELLSFLRQLGLQSDVSTTLWLAEAKNVTKQIKVYCKPSAELVKLSIVLMSSFENILKNINSKLVAKTTNLRQSFVEFLSAVSEIPFLYCPSPCNVVLHATIIADTPSIEHKYFVSFKESIFYKYSDLSCLVCSTLPQKCDFLLNLEPVFVQALGINEVYDTTMVVNNVIHLSEVLVPVKMLVSSEKVANSIEQLNNIIKSHYNYLLNHLEDRAILGLIDIPCIFLTATNNTSFQLIKPNQLVSHIPHNLDFRPFCYQTPEELSEYSELLKILGVQETIGPLQYIQILTNIRNQLGGNELLEDKSFLAVCENAYASLISDLRSLPDPPLIPEDLKIYLPSEDMCIVESNKLVYNDVPWIAAKLQNLQTLGYSFLKSPPFNDEGQRNPPGSLRVKYLSDLAAEKLHIDVMSKLNKCIDQELYETKHSNMNCHVVEVIWGTIKSNEFLTGISRLYWHKNQKHPKSNQVFFSQLMRLTDLNIICVNEIKTVICFDEKTVPETVDLSHFCYIVNDHDGVQLYITHRASHFCENRFFEQLAIEIGKYFGQCIGDTIYIKAMLQCDPSQISIALDKHQISPFDLYGMNSVATTSNEIGSEIPASEIHLSKEDFLIMCNYEEGEVVLYHALDKMGKSIFKVAKVIECHTRYKALLNDKCIALQIGNTINGDPLITEVSLLQLHKQLDTSQRKALELGYFSTYVKSLTLASLPDSNSEIEEWIRAMFVHNAQSVCCCMSHLSVRVTAHLHYILVVKGMVPEWFLPLTKIVIEILRENNSEEAVVEVKHLVQSLVDTASIENFWNPLALVQDIYYYPGYFDSRNTLTNLNPPIDNLYDTQPIPTRKLFSDCSIQKHKSSINNARWWLQQAKCDYLAAIDMYGAGNLKSRDISFSRETTDEQIPGKPCKFPALVCFLCHDVVEKCIKGLMFLKCGISADAINSNHLLSLYKQMEQSAYISSELKVKIRESVLQITEHCNKSRYPSYHIPPCTPASVYFCTDAFRALEVAHRVIIELQKDCQLNELIGMLDELPEKVNTYFSTAEGIVTY